MAVEQVGMRTPDGMTFGNATSDKLSFYGKTPIVQRSGAAQTAVATTLAVTSEHSTWGFTSSTQANAIVTLLNEIRAALVAVGLLKGAA